MAHYRTTLRNQLASLLGALTVPQNVYLERAHRIGPEDLPAVVWALTDDEQEEDDRAMGSPSFVVEDQQSLMVELHATGSAGGPVANSLDSMELEVEQILGADPTLGGAVENLYKTGSTLEYNVEQDRVLGVRVITYIMHWRHTFGSPDIPES